LLENSFFTSLEDGGVNKERRGKSAAEKAEKRIVPTGVHARVTVAARSGAPGRGPYARGFHARQENGAGGGDGPAPMGAWAALEDRDAGERSAARVGHQGHVEAAVPPARAAFVLTGQGMGRAVFSACADIEHEFDSRLFVRPVTQHERRQPCVGGLDGGAQRQEEQQPAVLANEK
jgi:hypothetical protein